MASWYYFTILSLTLSAINILYYVYFSRFAFSKPRLKTTDFPPISVIVCARNEAQNLQSHIPFLLKQDYPQFELILINHHSTDETAVIIEAFANKHDHVLPIHFKDEKWSKSGKKQAISYAIRQARYNNLLFIDADCRPASRLWLQTMSRGFHHINQIVLGYGAYKKIPHSFLNKLIRYETAFTALQYFGYAANNNAYMGVGRNLGYTQALFKATGGYAAHAHITAGDDDLFVNTAAKNNPVKSVYNPKAFTISQPKTRWNEWFLQKVRHTSVAGCYRKKHQLQLALFYISQLGFYLLVLAASVTQDLFNTCLAIIALRIIIVGGILYAGFYKLKEKDLALYFPLLELCLILVQFGIFIRSYTTSSIPWKTNQT